MASHLLLTQVLDDRVPAQRLLGLALSHQWRLVAQALVFYTDRGMSPGMRDAEALGQANGIACVYRKLYQS